MESNSQQSVDEALEKMRSEIVLTSSKAQQSALNCFDVLVNQLRNYNRVAVNLKKDVERLQELCEKNNIDHKQKAQEINEKDGKSKK